MDAWDEYCTGVVVSSLSVKGEDVALQLPRYSPLDDCRDVLFFQPYLQLAQDDKVRYQNEMKSWEAKMVELGREDLIRSREQRPKKKTDIAQEGSKALLRESLAKLKLKKSEE